MFIEASDLDQGKRTLLPPERQGLFPYRTILADLRDSRAFSGVDIFFSFRVFHPLIASGEYLFRNPRGILSC
jgi:hypothetical protein